MHLCGNQISGALRHRRDVVPVISTPACTTPRYVFCVTSPCWHVLIVSIGCERDATMTPPPKAPAMAAWGFEYLCANTPSSRRRVDGVNVMIQPRAEKRREI